MQHNVIQIAVKFLLTPKQKKKWFWTEINTEVRSCT